MVGVFNRRMLAWWDWINHKEEGDSPLRQLYGNFDIERAPEKDGGRGPGQGQVLRLRLPFDRLTEEEQCYIFYYLQFYFCLSFASQIGE